MPKPENLFSISDIATVCGVSINALRFYEGKGLLKPAYTSSDSGYRYYSRENLLRLRMILSLKEIGLSLGEIKSYLSGDMDVSEKLSDFKRRRALLDRAMEDLTARSTPTGVLQVREIELPERICLCRKVHAQDANHALVQIDAFYAELIRRGVRMSKIWPEFCEYPDMSLLSGNFPIADFTVVACVPVEAESVLHEAVLYPSGVALAVYFRGSYFKLHEAYATLAAYCKERCFSPVGYPQEVYLEIDMDGSVHPESESYTTRVILPVKKI